MPYNTRLFVGNLPGDTIESDLRSAFSAYGDIVNVDLKCKPSEPVQDIKKKFAFITLSTTNPEVESCIKHFANEDFKNKRLYVTRARESFLERLQREREQAHQKNDGKVQFKEPITEYPVHNFGNKHKRKLENIENYESSTHSKIHKPGPVRMHDTFNDEPEEGKDEDDSINSTKKKKDSETKRLESIKKKRQEFKEKKMIIKSSLIGIDKVPNRKVVFSDSDEDVATLENPHSKQHNKHSNNLFEGDESDGEVNFEIKEQFEGAKGQKVLDLQSRYKSDKRFILDERFIDDEEKETNAQGHSNQDEIDIGRSDEKAKQLNILQDVLGVAVKIKAPETEQGNKKHKTKLGMLRFDPTHPEHSKFLAPIEETKPEQKKNKKKKNKETIEEAVPEPVPQPVPTVEVSKEQFYNVSETLKEAIAQPNTFSLRSLFGNKEEEETSEVQEQETGYIPLKKNKESKMKNPLDRTDKNPFVYDSSDSENEESVPNDTDIKPVQENTDVKTVWKENLFFSSNDYRFKEGLAFFNKVNENEVNKERRELKSLMKKRMHNSERKNQMFQKKIGGRKKVMKKSFRNKRKT